MITGNWTIDSRPLYRALRRPRVVVWAAFIAGFAVRAWRIIR